ncbi:phosphatidylinositol mannoside acyltransferase [Actinospica sp. MGRD01-02]|uniref:Phosphatidylinositol mannoside acyltransferase n=1 Tax=Actinospica acidithermotolerans TaxID=2828514 RepID=A0A941EHX0_9ACTN|nr:phosphatidylinositol mannoside acyltransferase [Actinospica acidithermotolerans]MBR7829419.1 phosphatidylinositol mannoside acyltransferase [Actinospica acidithermotolerans]
MSKLQEELTYRAYATGWSLVRRLPERTAYALFRQVADRSWRKRGKSVRRLESNLARVLGPSATEEQIRAVSKQGMRSYMRYYCDTFRLETWSRERVVSTFKLENEQLLRDLLASRRGVVLALPHMGNWDHAGAWVAGIAEGGFTTVAERLKPEKLFERFLRYRESIGMEVLPLTGGTGTFGGLIRRLRAGGLVCLVAERDLTDRGVPVRFFGETTKLPAGPAALAVSTGAALCPVTLWYSEDAAHAKVWPEIEVPAEGTRQEKIAYLCQQVADVFAQGIAEHPADWHMLQRLWLVDLDPERAPAPAGASDPVEGPGGGAGPVTEAEGAAGDQGAPKDQDGAVGDPSPTTLAVEADGAR